MGLLSASVDEYGVLETPREAFLTPRIESFGSPAPFFGTTPPKACSYHTCRVVSRFSAPKGLNTSALRR